MFRLRLGRAAHGDDPPAIALAFEHINAGLHAVMCEPSPRDRGRSSDSRLRRGQGLRSGEGGIDRDCARHLPLCLASYRIGIDTPSSAVRDLAGKVWTEVRQPQKTWAPVECRKARGGKRFTSQNGILRDESRSVA